MISDSNIIRKLCLSEGLDTERPTLQKFGTNLLNHRSHAFFINLLIDQLNGMSWAIFEGIRSSVGVKLLKDKLKKSFIIYINASDALRWLRLYKNEEISKIEFERLNPVPLGQDTSCVKKKLLT